MGKDTRNGLMGSFFFPNTIHYVYLRKILLEEQPLWRHGDIRHKSTRFLKSNFRKQIAWETDVDFQRTFTSTYDITYWAPGQGGVCLAAGEPSRWALEWKEHAGKRVGGPRAVTPPAQPLRGFLKIIPVKMSSLFSLLNFIKYLFGDLFLMWVSLLFLASMSQANCRSRKNLSTLTDTILDDSD